MKLKVPSISCEGCAETITQAIKVADSNARVEVDVTAKTVSVESEMSDASVRQVIVGAGHEVES